MSMDTWLVVRCSVNGVSVQQYKILCDDAGFGVFPVRPVAIDGTVGYCYRSFCVHRFRSASTTAELVRERVIHVTADRFSTYAK